MSTCNRYLYFFAVSIGMLLFVPKPAYAQWLPVEGELTLAATQCSDNTEIYITRNSFLNYSNVYLFKNRKLIFSEEESDEMHFARDILCLKHGIIIFAEHGSYFSTLVLKSDNNKFSLETVGMERGPGEVRVTPQKTTITMRAEKFPYPTLRGGSSRDKPMQLRNKFTAVARGCHPQLTMRPQVSFIQEEDSRLTSRSWGYWENAINSYVAEAYVDKDGVPYVICREEGKVKNSPPIKLPFIATSGVMDDRHYLFGQKNNALQAVELIFDIKEKTFRIEPRDPNTIKFKPYLPKYSEGGPKKPVYTIRELSE